MSQSCFKSLCLWIAKHNEAKTSLVNKRTFQLVLYFRMWPRAQPQGRIVTSCLVALDKELSFSFVRTSQAPPLSAPAGRQRGRRCPMTCGSLSFSGSTVPFSNQERSDAVTPSTEFRSGLLDGR